MTFDRVHVPGLDFDGTVRTMLDDRERKSLEGTLARHAMHDQLTGLPNRTLFIDRLDQALARRRRSASMLAVLSIDLDRFKAVNDAVGHSAGDEILASCAGLMEAVLGPDETMCRLGGDEFAICSEGLTSPADAVEVAGRLAAALAQPFVHDGTSHTVTISVGIAVARGLPGERPEPLLRDADAAMYKAKSKGRRRYELSDESLRDETNRRIELVAGLSRAVERGELRLRYQPVMDLDSGRMVGRRGAPALAAPPSSACSARPPSSPSPRRPTSSSPSASGCSTPRSRSWLAGTTPPRTPGSRCR
jgi:diguanylate cyclase (GGDEF)-like protein